MYTLFYIDRVLKMPEKNNYYQAKFREILGKKIFQMIGA